MLRAFPSKNYPRIMGILNVTPDSFSDGGRHWKIEDAVEHTRRMIDDGADIIDIGGESTRPFAQPVSEKEELERVLPVIEAIRALSDIPLSIDTYKSVIARQAIKAGADIVNDISGLTFDTDMAGVISETGAGVIIMHIKGTPQTMQIDPDYDDVVSEVLEFLSNQVDYAVDAGIEADKIIIDPGIGFGKRLEDNLRILKHLRQFRSLGKPVLVGTSMKSFIGKLTEFPVEERIEGTLASHAIALMNGADIIRVHDVRKAVKVLKLTKAVMDA